MESVKTWKTVTANAEATEQLADMIGTRLRGGEVIELVSDLGGGKTTFVRGLARGAGSNDHVASPTFTLSRAYKAPKFDIHHFDFYRLAEAGIMANEVHELVHDPHAVVVVEWSDVVQHVLPDDRLTIHITHVDNDGREIVCTYPHSLRYLIEEHIS